MYTSFEDAVKEYLTPVPTPAGLSSRELVRKAIEFDNPPCLPYSSMSPLSGDFCEYRVLEIVASLFQKDKKPFGTVYYDEWGVGLEVTGRDWDQAIHYPLQNLSTLDSYHFPPAITPERLAWAFPHLQRGAEEGKYVIGRDPIMMAERVRSLMGFEEMMMAPYTHPDELCALLARLTSMTIEAIEFWASLGYVHGFMTSQDWGLQTGLQMKPETFREFYKPYYAQLTDACHRHGLHLMWHNCGYIVDIIPDMIELGVDVVQLDQPRVMGHQLLAERFGGRIAFFNSVDIQFMVQPDVPLTDRQIEDEVAEMVRPFHTLPGGLLLRQYIAPHSVGITEHQNRVAHAAFLKYGLREL